jgi:hypothetical protein
LATASDGGGEREQQQVSASWTRLIDAQPRTPPPSHAAEAPHV